MSVICEAPITRGPRKGQSATGTWAGYQRHLRANERACDPCQGAVARYSQGERYNDAPQPNAGVKNVDRHTGRSKMATVLVTCLMCRRRAMVPRKLVGKNTKIEACDVCRAGLKEAV